MRFVVRWISFIVLIVGLAAPAGAQAVHPSAVRPPGLNSQYHRAQKAWQSGTSLLEAKARVDRVLEAMPDDAEALKLRAQVLLSMDRPREAILDARRVVALTPDDGEAYLILCKAARVSGADEEARRAIAGAAKRVFDDASIHMQLSWYAMQLGELDQAEAFARIALNQGPQEPAAYYQLARVFALQGQPDAAATILARGFEQSLLDPAFIRSEALLAPLLVHPALTRFVE